jgi:hypothetical protein
MEITLDLFKFSFWPLALSALFDAIWLVAWTFIAIRSKVPVAMFLASFPILKWMLLLVAEHSGHPIRSENSALQPASNSPSEYWQTSAMNDQSDSAHDAVPGSLPVLMGQGPMVGPSA